MALVALVHAVTCRVALVALVYAMHALSAIRMSITEPCNIFLCARADYELLPATLCYRSIQWRFGRSGRSPFGLPITSAAPYSYCAGCGDGS
jgi:hypothetical protein